MDLVSTAMFILMNTRPLTFLGKYSAHLDYRGHEREGRGRGQEGRATGV